jgi:hypothetical protein
MLARLRELGPLEDDDARADLRYLENEHRIFLLGKGGGSQFPGRTELMKRWGWEDRAVRKLLAAEDWQDPIRPVAKEQLRQSFKGARKGEAEACPMTRQWPANEPPMTAPANADNQPIVSNERPMAVQSMSIARASSEPRSTTEPRGGFAPAAGLPPDLDALMPEAGLGFAMKLHRAGIETPADLLAMTLDELAHSVGIGHAIARKVQRELAKGPWRLAEPVARGSPRPRGSPPTEGAPPVPAPPPIPPGAPRQPSEDLYAYSQRCQRERRSGDRVGPG